MIISRLILNFALLSSYICSCSTSGPQDPEPYGTKTHETEPQIPETAEAERLYWLSKLTGMHGISITDLPIKNYDPEWTNYCVFSPDSTAVQEARLPEDLVGQRKTFKEAEYALGATKFWPYLLNALLAVGNLPTAKTDLYYFAAQALCLDHSVTALSDDDLRAVFNDINRSGVYTDEGFDAEEARIRQLLLLGYLFLAPAGPLPADEPLQKYVQGMGFLVCYFAWNWPLPIAGPACRRFINIYMREMYGGVSEGLGRGVKKFNQQSKAFLRNWVTANSSKLPPISSDIMCALENEDVELPLMAKTWLSCMLNVTQNFKQAEYLMFVFLINKVQNPKVLFARLKAQYYDPLLVINTVLYHYLFKQLLAYFKRIDPTHENNLKQRIESAAFELMSLTFSSVKVTGDNEFRFNYTLFCKSIDEIVSFIALKRRPVQAYLARNRSPSPVLN